jgi:fatty-acyl-CoA synthase
MTAKTQTIDSWLVAHARHQPEKPAMHFEGRTWSYAALNRWVHRLAAGMQHGLGLQRGDRVAFHGKNSDTEVALFFACAKLGLIFVPLNWRLVPAELNYIVGNAGAKVLFHSGEYEAEAAEVLAGLDTRPVNTDDRLDHLIAATEDKTATSGAQVGDPYLIVYTSGTTGRPKGAVLTQEAILWNAIISTHAHDFMPSDHILNMLPLFHVGGINIQMMPCFFNGATMTLHPAFDVEKAIKALEYEGITTTVCVPTVMKALLYHPDWGSLTLPTLRLFNTGSTDVPVEIIEANHKRGIPMVQVYGATETGPMATYQKAHEAVATQGSIGRCGAHTQVRLVREDGSDCEIGEPGEIWVKGPNNFSHYWQNPEATEAAIVDGWFRTGDVAYRDEKGLYWFADRVKHVIISGGENIYPAELERILGRIPGIVEAAVVGRAHPKWGEVPVAAVVRTEDGPTKEEILDAFVGQVARFKQPKDVVFLDALPRNTMGKVVAKDVRELVAQPVD